VFNTELMPNPRSLANLKPWGLGVSGNPKGRPPKAQPITEALRRLLAEPASEWEHGIFQSRTFAEQIAWKLLHIGGFGQPRPAIVAAIEILNRTEGRPADCSEEQEIDPKEDAEG